MIRINLNTKEDKKLSIEVVGHTQRDVCLAVSALTNSFVQYAKDFESNNMCEVEKKYASGNVKLVLLFKSDNAKEAFLKGVDALINGYALYQSNFKKEIEFNFNSVVTLQKNNRYNKIKAMPHN